MVAPTGSEEQIRYDILINAKAAIDALKTIMRNTEDNAEKMRLFSALVLDSSERWGISWQKSLAIYRQLNQELSKSKKATLFGQTGGQDLFAGTEKMLASTDALRTSQAQAKKGAEDLGNTVETSSKRAVRGIDAMRIAMGVLVSMILFRAIQAVEMFFRGAIDQAKQFEETLYRLRNVEETLSLSGIEISMAGLKKGIADIQKLLPIFSKEDVSQLVGNLAISTKQLGLNEKQILDLAKAVAILNVRSEKNEDLSTTAQHVLSSLLTGNAKGITALGIAFTDNTMRAKAMELGFLEADEALSSLTENEKGITKLNILLASTANETANINEYMDTNTAKTKENAAAWKDLQTNVGQIILPLIPTLTTGIQLINDGFNGLKVLLIEVITLVSALSTAWVAQMSGMGNFTDVFKMSIESFRESLVNEFFQDVPENAPDWFMAGWGKHIKEEAETATGPLQALGDAAEDLEEIDLDKLAQEIEDIIEDTANAQEDLAINLDRKLADLDEEYRRKALDAEQDYLRKIEDINRDAERDIRDIKEKQREEDIRDEEKYQLQLWELRMRFLMNLEDALHARDARQVLRLQKQYAIDKEALERKHALDNKEREQNQRDELEDAEQRKQERLEDARLEYQEKLADLNIAKQREQQDLQTWYEREQADIVLAQQRKLETLLKGWMDEKKITEANAAEVYGILLKYFGPGGMTDELYKYMAQSLAANTVNAINGVLSQLGSIGGGIGGGGFTSPLPSNNSGGSAPVFDHVREGSGRSVGDSLLATRPTTSILGESGLSNLTPMSRVGKSAGTSFGDSSGGGGVNGTIRVAVDLSPDLQGRIVEQSMDGVAEVLSKVNRSKF
jgi:hypothetical protein